MSEYRKPARNEALTNEIGEDPFVCSLMLDALDLQALLDSGADIESVRRQIDRHNALFASLIGQQAVVRGEVYIPTVDDTASVWEDGLALSYDGLALEPQVSGHRVAHTFLYSAHSDSDELYVARATASTESIVTFPWVASDEYLEQLYEALRSDRNDNEPLPDQIDEVIVKYCDDPAELLHQLGRLDYAELPLLGFRALQAVAHNLDTRVMVDLPPHYLRQATLLCKGAKDSYKIIGADDDCLFVPRKFEFIAAPGEGETTVPLLGIVGTVTSRSASLLNQPVRLPVQDVDIERFVSSE